MHLEKNFDNNYAVSFIVHMGLCYTRERFQIVQTWNTLPGIRLGKFEPTSRLSHVELDFLLPLGIWWIVTSAGHYIYGDPTAYIWASGRLWNVLSIFHGFKDQDECCNLRNMAYACKTSTWEPEAGELP